MIGYKSTRRWSVKVRYRVFVYCASNDLHGMVEVVSLTRKSAGEMALRVFFKGGGWTVEKVEAIT